MESDAPQRASRAKHDQRREALLDEAARMFNAAGVSSTRISDIPGRVGLARASLYHYVRDKDDLIFQCYLRGAEATAEHLRRAEAEGGRGLDRLLRFVDLALDKDNPPAAVLFDVASLPEAFRKQIETADQRNGDRVAGFVRAGMGDGSIRPCMPEVVSNALLGMISCVGITSWFPLQTGDHDTGSRRALATASAIASLVEQGVGATDAPRPLRYPLDVLSLDKVEGNLFDNAFLTAAKTEQILTAACRLINRKGVDGTSLDDVGEALGVSKAVLYHYVDSKEDLLVHAYDRSLKLYERYALHANQVGRSALERSLVALHLNVQSQLVGPWPLTLMSGADDLPADMAARIDQRARALHQRSRKLCADGIADGSMRPGDHEIALFASAGAVGWIPKRMPEHLTHHARLVADEYADLFAWGLKA